MILSTACLCFGAVCFLYYVILAVYAGPDFNFGWFWILLGIMSVSIAVLGRFRDQEAALWIRRLLAMTLAGALVYYLVPKAWRWTVLLALSLVFYYFAGRASICDIMVTMVRMNLTENYL